MPTPPPRRGDKRERTRAALIAAALEVSAEKGFAGASLEEIARRAGMSRGAIYSNFEGRAQLMVAAVSSVLLQIDRSFAPAPTLKAQLRAFADNLIAELPKAPGVGRMHAEFYLHAMTDPELRAFIAAGYAEGFQRMATQFETQQGARLTISPKTLAVTVQALTMGFLAQTLLTPDEISDAAVREAFDALADAAIGAPRTPLATTDNRPHHSP